jgi:GT2 family glycosyltransferase
VPDLSIISVTFNSRDQILNALQSASAAASEVSLSHEVIVVDNASADGTPELVGRSLPAAILLRSERNVGFGAANNLAFERATGDRWLLLNPDARIDAACLRRLWATLAARPDVAAIAPSTAGPHTRVEDGGMLPGLRSIAGHFLFINRFLPADHGGRWRGLFVQRRGPLVYELEWIGAAVMLARPEAIRVVGGFDPSIFLYGEDIDLGSRLGQAGWRLLLDPSARATHAIAGSQGGVSAGWVDGTLIVYGRAASRRRQLFAAAMMGLGLAIRVVASDQRDPLHRRRMRTAALRALRWCAGVPRPVVPPHGRDIMVDSVT